MADARKTMQGLKTIRSIKTIGALVDQRRARTASGALLELSALGNERQRLQNELERWHRRHEEIATRLVEITAKEQWLYSFVKCPVEPPGATAKPIPLASPMQRVRARELKY